MDLMELFKEFGLPIALVVYFLWRDSKKQKSDALEKQELIERINEVEDFQKNELQELVKNSIKVTERNTHVLNQFCNQYKLSSGNGNGRDTLIFKSGT